ncbi:MAG: HAD family hydrolase [Polyangiaceae bacterium]|nr:HAD family hydrolase [Polyangiaceae bacterium]
MAEAPAAARLAAAPAGPRGERVGCATCGATVDALRAPRVALYGGTFRYFCSSGCREGYVPPIEAPPLAPAPRSPSAPAPPLPALPAAGPLPDDPAHAAPAPELGGLLLGMCVAGCLASLALALAGGAPAIATARLVIAAVALAALVAEYALAPRDAGDAHPLALLAAPVLATGGAGVARVSGGSPLESLLTLAAVVTGCAAAAAWALRRERRALVAGRERVERALGGWARREGASGEPVPALRLRPGEEITVAVGETVLADGRVTRGDAIVAPWLGAAVTEARAPGDPIVAGARVVEGELTLLVTAAGPDRAWYRLTCDPLRRADVHAEVVRAARLFAEPLAPFIAGGCALVGYAAGLEPSELALSAIGVQSALAASGVAGSVGVLTGGAVFALAARGVSYRSVEAFDAASRVTVAMIQARGTLLAGEPDLVGVHGLGRHDADDALALAAGAALGSDHPLDAALTSAARTRGIRPELLRGVERLPGFGVTATDARGRRVAVGSRTTLLGQAVGTGVAEPLVREAEAAGRTVILVAVDGHPAAVLSFQDAIRSGARAAIRHLLDAGIEPVLVGGDSRETCEAVGRALDIDHVRAEVPLHDRAEVVRHFTETGARVAVVGRTPRDDGALAAADVSVALGAAGGGGSDFGLSLASGEVRDAALALAVSRRARAEALVAVGLVLAPSALAGLTAALGMVPPVVCPVAGILGGAAALLRVRIVGRSLPAA